MHTTLLLLLVAFLCGVFTGIRGFLFRIAMTRLKVRLRNTLFGALLHQETGFYDTVKSGGWRTREGEERGRGKGGCRRGVEEGGWSRGAGGGEVAGDEGGGKGRKGRREGILEHAARGN